MSAVMALSCLLLGAAIPVVVVRAIGAGAMWVTGVALAPDRRPKWHLGEARRIGRPRPLL
ncbi:hypothetical protein DEF24_02845 [Marinitenerispora sediminis]|uniref:Uncharacterized protein n=1 Tax=Marinitenerispora sediminis TaxID=1931232 RepID=A0A368TAJ5_9ACTN|nr:hypothetical protein DEF24_02845 [Marinitenerispora sediminis]